MLSGVGGAACGSGRVTGQCATAAELAGAFAAGGFALDAVVGEPPVVQLAFRAGQSR
jgi:hypothetical protein